MMKSHTTSTRLRSALLPVLMALAPSLAASAAMADCNRDYTVRQGDTYYSIADAHYGTRQEWQRIYQANQSSTGMPMLMPGNKIYIPCLNGSAVTDVEVTSGTVSVPAPVTAPAPVRAADPAPARAAAPPRNYPKNAEIRLLTGGGYAPFTDKNLPGEGLITELVHAALDNSPSPVTYSVTWENDWSKHLFPLLDERSFDMGFPWLKPDCAALPGDDRCANFLFSDPLMSLPIMLFVRADNQFRFETDADVVGKTLCRPAGYFTHDLDRADRRWLSKRLITFVEGRDPADCLTQVMTGKVDAASINLFLGANLILEMGLRNQILPLEKPLSQEGLHVVISKTHWRGTTHLYRLNAGLQKLKDGGQYQEIVSRHLELFRSQLQ